MCEKRAYRRIRKEKKGGKRKKEKNARGKKKMRKGASEGRYSDPPSAQPPSGIYDTYMYYLSPTNNPPPPSEPSLFRWRWIKEKKKYRKPTQIERT